MHTRGLACESAAKTTESYAVSQKTQELKLQDKYLGSHYPKEPIKKIPEVTDKFTRS